MGFDSCAIDRLLVADAASFDNNFSVYEVSVPDETMRNALTGQKYASRPIADGTLFSKGRDFELISNQVLSYFNRLAISGQRVVRAAATNAVEAALASSNDPRSSALVDPTVGGLIEKMGDVDAVILLPTHRLASDAPPGVDEIVAGTPPPFAFPKGAKTPAYHWGTLTPPRRIAVGYWRDDGGDDVMKFALSYSDGRHADEDRDELEKRLTAFRFFGDTRLCDRVATTAESGNGGAVVIGVCTNGLAPGWWRIVTGEGLPFLATHPPPE